MDTKQLSDLLQPVLNKYADEATELKKQLLAQQPVRYTTVHSVLRLHDQLLFLTAYPDDRTIAELSLNGLKGIASYLYSIKDTAKIAAYSGSGLPYTELICSYSFELTEWLIQKFGDDVQLHSAGADKEMIRETLKPLFPDTEYWQTTQDELAIDKRIRLLKAKSKENDLAWLLKQFKTAGYAAAVRDYMYSNLKLYSGRVVSDVPFSRSFLKALPAKVYYHDSIIKQVDSREILNTKIPAPEKISTADAQHLIDMGRASLAYYYRETDPVTYADPNEVRYVQLERGISIVLYGMKKSRRFSMESYIGYIACKNGVPMAYGGGWMLGNRCKIGVNIYPPFRGGESANVFSQIMRVYRQYYGASRFVVKPYQFGKGNPEGIQTGAYWFYYKLGYRSADNTIAAIAADEWDKIQKVKSYKTPTAILKKFTDCNLELVLDERSVPDFDAGAISSAVTAMIKERFNADRQTALAFCTKKLIKYTGARYKPGTVEYKHVQQLSLWFGMLDLASWSEGDIHRLAEITALKSADDERRYVKHISAHKRLWSETKKMLSY